MFFLVFNLAFVLFRNVPLGRLTLYNSVFKGRERLPFGENPSKSHSISLFNLDAMLASHVIQDEYNSEHEYNIVLLGDSSVWGFLQEPQDTLAGILNRSGLSCAGKPVKVYNLAYPSLSVVKDLMLLNEVKSHAPNMVLWLVTLESLPVSMQMKTPLVASNHSAINHMLEEFGLMDFPQLPDRWSDNTLIARRRELADLMRLQLYGVAWSATGIDQHYPIDFVPAQRDLEADQSFHDLLPGEMTETDLSLEVIVKAVDTLKDINFILINEPILISQGENSHLRYNFYYPRWAYDQYRDIMQAKMAESAIQYVDFWDLIPEKHFTNSAIHLDKEGELLLADEILSLVQENCHLPQ